MKFNFGKNYSFNSGFPDKSEKNYIIDGVEYYALKQEQFLPDRRQYVEESWESDYPTKKGYSYDKIILLVGRSSVIADWYASVMLKYREGVGMPVHVQDLLEVEEFNNCRQMINKLNDRTAELSKEKQQAAADYKKKLKEIDDQYKDIQESKDSNDLLFILTLTSNDLPLGLIDRIADYTPGGVNDPLTTKIYAREQLLRYQRFLIIKHKEGEDIKERVAQDRMDFDFRF